MWNTNNYEKEFFWNQLKSVLTPESLTERTIMKCFKTKKTQIEYKLL
jgi:hypothetical protein